MPKEPFVPVLYAATFENIFTTLAVGRAVQWWKILSILWKYPTFGGVYFSKFHVQNKSKIKVSLIFSVCININYEVEQVQNSLKLGVFWFECK